MNRLLEIFFSHPKIVTDSRRIEPNCLFFALKGDNFDGNRFAKAALEAGAAFAVVDDPTVAALDPRCLLVENVLASLQNLARDWRRTFQIPVIAITGSNGKTTTKELVAGVLAAQYRCHFTLGNFNNHIGVPLTLLAMPRETEVAVIEMGANHQKEIAELCQIAEPTHGLLTNVGKAHLDGFGGFEGVKKGKSELFEWLAEAGGLAFINQNEPFLADLAQKRGVRKAIFYKTSEKPSPLEPAIETQFLSENPFLKIGFLAADGQILEAQSQLVGRYNLGNLATAVALGKYFKVPFEKIAAVIEDYAPKNMRSQLLEKGENQFVLDAYNANPTSMKNALENFERMAAPRKIAVLGDMRELGAEAEKEHLQIVKMAQKMGFEKLVLVGAEFEKAAKKAKSSALVFADSAAAKNWFDGQKFSGATFLIKGSRGIRLEILVEDSSVTH